MPLIAFSPRKTATVLYNMTASSDSAVLLAHLGKHTTGKACLCIKKLSDVGQKVLESGRQIRRRPRDGFERWQARQAAEPLPTS
jgi:hypothetical protein